jgi:hypothetical protein
MARKRKSWWPKDLPGQLKWFPIFIKMINTYGEVLKITDDELESATKDCAAFISYFTIDTQLKNYKKACDAYRKNSLKGKTQVDIGDFPVWNPVIPTQKVMSGLLVRTFNFVKSIKTRKGYNAVIGTAGKILGDNITPIDKDKYIPKLKGKAFYSFVALYLFKGQTDGHGVFCQRGKDPEFYEIGFTSKNKFKDSLPNINPKKPEIRCYKVRARIGNDYIGNFSGVVEILWMSPTLNNRK